MAAASTRLRDASSRFIRPCACSNFFGVVRSHPDRCSIFSRMVGWLVAGGSVVSGLVTVGDGRGLSACGWCDGCVAVLACGWLPSSAWMVRARGWLAVLVRPRLPVTRGVVVFAGGGAVWVGDVLASAWQVDQVVSAGVAVDGAFSERGVVSWRMGAGGTGALCDGSPARARDGVWWSMFLLPTPCVWSYHALNCWYDHNEEPDASTDHRHQRMRAVRQARPDVPRPRTPHLREVPPGRRRRPCTVHAGNHARERQGALAV